LNAYCACWQLQARLSQFNYLYAADDKSEAEQEIDISTMSR